MTDILKVGDLAYVIDRPGILPNRVRTEPEIDENDREHNVIGKIPENATLAILPGPVRWPLDYPYNDGVHTWFRVRGRTDKRGLDGRFKIIEGWTAVSERGSSFLRRVDTRNASPEKNATFVTHLQDGRHAYVLPKDGLNIRKQAGAHADTIDRGLLAGTVVTVIGQPACVSERISGKVSIMVWWQMKLLNSSRPIGWVSEGNFQEWLLAPYRIELQT